MNYSLIKIYITINILLINYDKINFESKPLLENIRCFFNFFFLSKKRQSIIKINIFSFYPEFS